jgi:hypothetical protein
MMPLLIYRGIDNDTYYVLQIIFIVGWLLVGWMLDREHG